MLMKNYNDIIGNRTRDIPSCCAVPQPTAPPRALSQSYRIINFLATVDVNMTFLLYVTTCSLVDLYRLL